MNRGGKGHSELRAHAEQRLGRTSAGGKGEGPDARLLHELEVHQAELEIQNEELRGARLSTEAALARYTDLFELAPIGYATLSIDGAIREINQVGTAMLGAKRPLVGWRFSLFVLPSQRQTFDQMLRHALARELKQSCEVELVDPKARSGSAQSVRTQVHFTAVALQNAGPLVLLAFQDISERKAREAELARAQQDLRDADRRKDEFLAVLSHELRNPLAPIRSSLYILDRAQPGSAQAKHAQAIIERQVGHIIRLVDDLLDVTRIIRGKIQLRRERIEAGELIRRSIDDHRPSFQASGIRLDTDFAPGPFWIDADPTRIVQVLSNLLNNAEKFTPKGGTVTVGLQREGGRLTLRVRDTGAGIAPELQARLFEPFTQAPQTMDRSRGGLGLGLAMVKGLVELHGGGVAIHSDGVDRGTEVTVWLPIEAHAESPIAAKTVAPESKRRIVVIEDNPDGADSLRDVLELAGHHVQVAHDGPAGLDLVRTFQPQAVICDIGLPGMDGYEVARRVRADAKAESPYLIALSGYAQSDDIKRAIDAGFDQHVSKPPSLETLSRLLSELPASRPAVELRP
jgi:two-component system CheB/CheR fusion protein